MVFNTNYRLMQVKSIAAAILSTFIKPPFAIKIFVLSIFEWPLKTGFTAYIFKGVNTCIKDPDKTARMRRLICAVSMHIHQNR